MRRWLEPRAGGAPRQALLPALLAYAAASLAHHLHNARYLREYPNLPAWLSPAGVYLAWALVTLLGLAGSVMLRRHALGGLALLGGYACLGLTGLAHYVRAPVAAHSHLMNLSIGCEVVTAAVLLLVVVSAGAQLRCPAPVRQQGRGP